MRRKISSSPADKREVGFSIRDKHSGIMILRGQRGQGIIEYILVLVVTVMLILGVMYKFNSAFKEYALSYFGNYLSCLLETGELPTIGGTPGDSGICNELFHTFTLEDGRMLKAAAGNSGGGGSGGSGGGATEKGASGGGGARSRVSGGGGSQGFGGSRGFNRGSNRSMVKGGKGGKGKADGAYTGSTNAENYGGNYGETNRKLKTGVKHRLDNKFAMQDEKEEKQKRKIAGVSKKSGEESSRTQKRSRLKANGLKKASGEAPDAGMSFPDFMRYIIIAGILIALFLFIGGQMLQISKSSD